MNRNYLVGAMIVSALVGLTDSAYLTYLSFSPPTSCPIGEFSIFACNEVIYSQYAHVYGISVALLGFGWFLIALGLILVTRRKGVQNELVRVSHKKIWSPILDVPIGC
jgi:uncharacterized membrane protein